jgi:sigma-B regulation protein RsbU (phosphoserine phosphatase)
MTDALMPTSPQGKVDQARAREQLIDRRSRLHSAMSTQGTADLQHLLSHVDAALERLDNGSFGLCETCHDPVEQDRIAADPTVRVCLECLSDEQRAALEHDLELATHIQRALLPARRLRTGGWEFHVHFEPAGPVSGDFFDLVRPWPDREDIFFVVGDVSGKGVSAALLGSHLQAIFRSLAVLDLPVSEAMTRANHLFSQSTMANSYATLVFGRARSSGRIELANAGHVPPMVVRRNGVSELAATGVPLGMFTESRFDEQRIVLEPEDRMLLFTDGLTEAYNEREQEYGFDAVRIQAADSWGCSAEETVQASVRDLERFRSGTPRHDDLTVVAARRTAEFVT